MVRGLAPTTFCHCRLVVSSTQEEGLFGAYLSGMACTNPPSAVNMAPADDPSFPTGVSTVLRKLRGIPVTRT